MLSLIIRDGRKIPRLSLFAPPVASRHVFLECLVVEFVTLVTHCTYRNAFIARSACMLSRRTDHILFLCLSSLSPSAPSLPYPLFCPCFPTLCSALFFSSFPFPCYVLARRRHGMIAITDLQQRDPDTFKPLHIVSMTIRDSAEDSAAAAGDVLELCKMVNESIERSLWWLWCWCRYRLVVLLSIVVSESERGASKGYRSGTDKSSDQWGAGFPRATGTVGTVRRRQEVNLKTSTQHIFLFFFVEAWCYIRHGLPTTPAKTHVSVV